MSVRRIMIRVGILLLIMLAPTMAAAQKTNLQEGNFTYYYFAPEKVKTVELVKWLAEQQTLTDPNAVYPVVGFFTILAEKAPDQLLHAIDEASLKGKELSPFALAYWHAGNLKIADLLARRIPLPAKSLAQLKTPPPPLLKAGLSKPGQLDMLWGAFMASGDTRYAARIIDVLDLPDSGDGSDASMISIQLLKKAASWSLGSNARQHELIRRLCVRELARRSGSSKKALQQIVASLGTPDHPFPSADGRFSALLAPTKDATLYKRWEELAGDKDPGIKITEQAKRGERVTMPIFFMGEGLDKDLRANLTYDMKVVAPNGSTYFTGKNITAFSGRLPTSTYIQMSTNNGTIEFEQTDQLGIYKILVDLADHVSHKTLRLTGTVELVQ